jgi:hypothetical protein
VAGKKEKYRDLRQMTLGEPLDFDDDQFAAVSSAGVFTQGHAPLSGFDELIRITRSGGHIVDASERYNSTPLEGELMAKVYAYQVV